MPYRSISPTALQTPLTWYQRERLGQLVSALGSRRLVTLARPSGVGKSFLASAICRNVAEGSMFAAALDARSANRIDEAEHYLRTALEDDRYNESRYVMLADLMLSEGRFGHAKSVVLRAASMATELGLEPSTQVRELLFQLREVMS